jgi:aspartokinase-like uncharacterized kinase
LADAVRALDNRLPLGDDVAHWMAILSMDQHARLLVDRIDGAVLVEASHEISQAVADHQTPVLAPSRWLREADPLPHAWSVTSDSVAAWVAAAVGAPRLLLIKSIDAPLGSVVDEHFATVLHASVAASVVAASRIEELGARLDAK